MISPDLFGEEYEEQHVADDAQDEHDEDHDPAHRELDVRHQGVALTELEQWGCYMAAILYSYSFSLVYLCGHLNP